MIIYRAFLLPGPGPRTCARPQVGRSADVSLEQDVSSTDSARVLHAGLTSAPKAVLASQTPRQRGTIYEALPYILEHIYEGGPRSGALPHNSHSIIDGERSRCFDIIDSIKMREETMMCSDLSGGNAQKPRSCNKLFVQTMQSQL